MVFLILYEDLLMGLVVVGDSMSFPFEDCFVLFNSAGKLQIGINKGNASELLGLSVDSPVLIEFTT